VKRLVLVHWHPAEAAERAEVLRIAGYRTTVFGSGGAAGLREFRVNPPDGFVIDLTRLPSHGRAVATALRQQKGTRHVPLVFAGGEPAKVEATRKLLPDAVYAEWRNIRGALQKALASQPETPVVPDTMAGYSGRPLPKKLGIKPGIAVALLGAPDGFAARLNPLPKGARLQSNAGGMPQLAVLFARSQHDLQRRFPAAAKALADKGSIWIAWPKKTSALAADLTQAGVRAFGLAAGFVDYKVAALDETWSGLLFTRRRKPT